jgi:TfoX/Sxy family transcriptional regulator of competence genes
MGSDKSHLEYVMDQIASAGDVTARAMFGEYGIYCDGKICALFCDNKLFVKPTEPGRAFIQKPVEAPPYPGAKLYYLIEEKIDDRRWVSELIRITADALPAPKPRTRKPKSKPVAGSKPSRRRSPKKKSTPPKRGRTAF